MRRKSNFLLLGLLLVSHAHFAQWTIGPKAGATFNTQITKITGSARADVTVAPGFGVGLQASHSFSKHLAFLLEVNYIQKNLAYKGNNVFASLYSTEPFLNTSYTLQKNYVELPMGIRLQTGGRFKGFANLGGYAGYWLSGRWTVKEVDLVPYDVSNLPTDGRYPIQSATTGYTFNSNYNADGHSDQRLDYGVFLGLGIQHSFSWGNLWLEGRSQLGLVSLDQFQSTRPNGAWNRSNGTAGVYLGASFPMSR